MSGPAQYMSDSLSHPTRRPGEINLLHIVSVSVEQVIQAMNRLRSSNVCEVIEIIRRRVLIILKSNIRHEHAPNRRRFDIDYAARSKYTKSLGYEVHRAADVFEDMAQDGYVEEIVFVGKGAAIDVLFCIADKITNFLRLMVTINAVELYLLHADAV